MSNENLFSEFEPLSIEEWKKNVEKDLKGRDFSETLTWLSPEGIEVQPYFNQELKVFSIDKEISDWDIIEPITVKSIKEANKQALNALMNGATAIQFDLLGKEISSLELNELFNNIRQDIAKVFLKNTNYKNPNYPYIEIDGFNYKNEQSNIIEELTNTLLSANKQFELIDDHSNHNYLVRFSTGSNFFFEISKLKAFRNLWSVVFSEYDNNVKQPYILSTSTVLNKSLEDVNDNLLRNTSEAMAAILGGADGLIIRDHQLKNDTTDDFGNRIARNISLILKEESYFNKVINPTEGSYYIEYLTNEIQSKVWKNFVDAL